jgi:hypothetical protein
VFVYKLFLVFGHLLHGLPYTAQTLSSMFRFPLGLQIQQSLSEITFKTQVWVLYFQF